MLQPHSREYPGTNDMQFWQQQLMHKQLQEFQNQQQLQQLDQGASQHNSLNQLCAVTKPVTLNQSAMMNETPTNNAPNYMWPNNLLGSLPPMPGGNSQMMGAANMNWVQSVLSPSVQNVANGLMIPDDHSQTIQSFGYIHQQEQSFYGVPVSNIRVSVNQYPQLSRLSNGCDNSMTQATDNQATTNSNKLNRFQKNHDVPARRHLQYGMPETTRNLQGKGFFINNVDILNGDAASENFHQANGMQSSVQDQTFHGSQDQVFRSGDSQEGVTKQLGTSNGVASLDPTEEKILYGNDDEWGASFASSLNSSSEGPLHGLPLGNGCCGGFPSIQSGSWSALMQEAVGSSTSDSGIHEEWNGLDFHKMEQSMLKPPDISGDCGKQGSTWNDNNVRNVSSLASKNLSINSIDSGPNPSTAPTSQHSYQSISHKQSHQGQKQLSECGTRVQMSEINGMWMGQTYQQQNNFVDLQNNQGSWTHQQNLMTPNAMWSDNRPNGWNDSYEVEPSGGNNSVFSTDGNSRGTAAIHCNPNSRVGRSLESDVDTSQFQTDGSFVNTYGSVMNSNSPIFNRETNQRDGSSQQVVHGKTFALDACARAKDDGNVGRNHTAPNEGQPKSWASTLINETDEGGNYQLGKKQPEGVSGEIYASSNSNDVQQSNILSGGNGSSTWSSYGQNPFRHRNLKPSSQSAHPAAGSFMSQNQMNLGMNKESSYSTCHSHFQGVYTPIFQGSNFDDQVDAEKLDFNGPNLSNNNMDARKSTLTGTEDLCSRDDISAHGSASFDPSTVNCSQNKNITQTSQNMQDLLPKVDQARNCNTVAVSDKPAKSAVSADCASPQSSTQGFGLQLAPPPQRQLSQTGLSLMAFTSDGKSRQNNAGAGDKSQDQSSYALAVQSFSQNNAAQKESLSIISENRPMVASDFSGQLNSLPTYVPDISYLGNQQHPQITSAGTLMQHQHKQRQNACSSAGREVPHLSVKFLISDQTTFARNASMPRQPHDSLDNAVRGQFVQTSGVLSPGLSPVADISEPSSLKSNPLERVSMKKMIAGSDHVHNSGSFLETEPGLQRFIAGTSQQDGFSRMLHNVWTKLSAQHRLAGVQLPKLTPQTLQSIINNSRDTGLWSPQKANEDKGGPTPEVGRNYSDLEHQREQRINGAFLNQICSHVDASPKTGVMSQGHEVAWISASDGGSNVSVSSLVHLHQLDVSKVKSRQDVVPQPQTSNAPIGGRTLMTSDVRQQNYSVLQQIQEMRGGDSERRILSGNLRGINSTSGPQVDWNTGQGPLSGQNSDFNVQVDGKVGASLQSSFPSNVAMLNLTSMDNEENNTNISTATGGQHDSQNQMGTLGTNSAGKSVKGMEHTQISLQMTPSWFEKYGLHRDRIQRNPSASISHYLFQKVPTSMDCNLEVDPTSDGNHIDIHGRGSVSAAMVTKELSSVLNQGVFQRPKKRKCATPKLISWHKVVTQGQQRSISTAEHDWARAANRLFAKVDDEAQNMEENLSIIQPHRRIALTTQLMQQLIPTLPAKMLRVEADLACENVTFCVAKSALTDACSMISCSEKDWDGSLENERGTSKKFKSSVRDRICSTLVEDYIGRSKKLENDFLRFYKRTSILDVRLECQELEKFSIINRLGKFHGRLLTDPEIGTRGMFIQRYVTALSVAGNHPEGIMYLSL